MVATRVRAFLEIPNAGGFTGWGQADITGILNPTLRDVWRQLIVNFEGVPGGYRYIELPTRYKDSSDYTIELQRPGQLPNRGPPFTMDTPYVDGQFPYLTFVYGPGDPTPLEGGKKRRRKSKRTRGRRSLSTRAASRGTRRY